jgi:hypothetical protein
MLLHVMLKNVLSGNTNSASDPILWILSQCINGKELAPAQQEMLAQWLSSSPIHQTAFNEMMDPRYVDRYVHESYGYT